MSVEFTKEEWLTLFKELNDRISKLEEYINGCKEGQKLFEEIMGEQLTFDSKRPTLKPTQT